MVRSRLSVLAVAPVLLACTALFGPPPPTADFKDPAAIKTAREAAIGKTARLKAYRVDTGRGAVILGVCPPNATSTDMPSDYMVLEYGDDQAELVSMIPDSFENSCLSMTADVIAVHIEITGWDESDNTIGRLLGLYVDRTSTRYLPEPAESSAG